MKKFLRSLLNKILSQQPNLNSQSTARMCLFTARPILHVNVTQKSLEDSINELRNQLTVKGYLKEPGNGFDTKMQQAVKDFQADNKLCIDGVVGPLTWACLYYPSLSRRSKNTSKEIWEAISLLQDLLQEEGFSIKDPVGTFGKDTERSVKRFQRANGLVADGIVGAWTWTVLLGVRQESEASLLDVLLLHLYDFPFLFERSLTGLFVLASFGVKNWFALQAACILTGIYFSPTDEKKPSLPVSFFMSLGLVTIVPVIFSLLPSKNASFNPEVLNYACCVLIGMLWSPALESIKKLFFK